LDTIWALSRYVSQTIKAGVFMDQIELEAMPELPEVLTRDVTVEESRTTLDLRAYFLIACKVSWTIGG
jgi:hypothetical protein